MKPITYVSSDGHTVARMPQWRDYLPARLHPDFDEFLKVYAQYGSKNFDRPALESRLDPQSVEEFTEQMVTTRRVEAVFEVDRRLKEIDTEVLVGRSAVP